MKNAHSITKEFEAAVADYTGAPYCVALDNCCNALFLALKYVKVKGINIFIPKHTYPGVPCEIINAGAKVNFYDSPEKVTGAYQLKPTKVWDAALSFTADMYLPGSFMCLSFTGPYKRLKLEKGGAILTDSKDAYDWFRKARFSGRGECSYFEDTFEMTGWNFYMEPSKAARGLLLMNEFYNRDGSKKEVPDLSLPYPDLSKQVAYK